MYSNDCRYSLLIYSQRFGWCILWPSSRTREPTQNCETNALSNPGGGGAYFYNSVHHNWIQVLNSSKHTISYHSQFSDYCFHLHCNIHNVSLEWQLLRGPYLWTEQNCVLILNCIFLIVWNRTVWLNWIVLNRNVLTIKLCTYI